MKIISNASRKRKRPSLQLRTKSNQGLTQAVAIKQPQVVAMTTTNQKQQVMTKKKSSRKLPKP
jgi:hypothetical protein